jgi:molybdopterin molybdotransferase
MSAGVFQTKEGFLTVNEALALLAQRVRPVLGLETLPLSQAAGRVLAQAVEARISVPPHANSAVDGYAVHAGDLLPDQATRLPVTGRIAAGHPLDRAAKRGEALRIFTGAPVPDGPDTIFMQEHCQIEEEGRVVLLPPGLKRFANLRQAGEDAQAGHLVFQAGRRLGPQDLALAAAVGHDRLTVRRRLKAAIFSTGDEIRDAGQPLAQGCVYDANRYSLMALLGALGIEVTDLGILPDDLAAIQSALGKAAQGHDLILTSGGVSLGEEDHVKAAVLALGELHFWRLAVKPGRPVALGEVSGIPFVGLPGNPVAAIVMFALIARPLALLLMGASDIKPRRWPVQAGFDFTKAKGRREYQRVRLVEEGGNLVAHRFEADGSGILSSLVLSDALLDIAEEETDIRKGGIVHVLPFSEVLR